jgi:hypothetical protein
MVLDASVPIGRRFSGHGIIFSNNNLSTQVLPPEHRYYLGSFPLNELGYVPFTGLYLMSNSSPNIQVLQGRLQFDMTRKFNVSLLGNLASMQSNYNRIFHLKQAQIARGYGLSLGYETILGPIHFNLAHSNLEKVVWYINLGVRF